MSWMRPLKYIALGLCLAYAFPAACGNGGVVGGECKKVPGSNECDPNAASGAGRGGAKATGGATNTGGDSPNEAGNGSAAAPVGGDGQLPDGGFFDSPVDGQSDAEAPLECLPPHDSPTHCGDCDTQCKAPEPLCAPNGEGSFECVPKCEPPLVECQGQCVDPESYNSDPDNCGKCGNACPSDICQAGKCVGARYGNVALLCMDFNSVNAASSPTTLLGNAVFTPPTNPVRVLSYTRGASAAAVNRVNQVIGWAGMPRNRSAEFTEAKTVDDVTAKLNIADFQVLLIHDLDQAGAGEPAAAATTWESGSVLSSFAKAGGVIIVLDGGDGRGEMHELINAGNLLDPTGKISLTGETEVTGEQVWNNAPFDVLGANVLSPFLGTSHTCTFDTAAKASSDTIFVLSDDEAGGLPIAIHRVIAP
ncbi:MAG: hypothetical protein ABUL60_09750 [Myxococcales bacterium]